VCVSWGKVSDAWCAEGGNVGAGGFVACLQGMSDIEHRWQVEVLAEEREEQVGIQQGAFALHGNVVLCVGVGSPCPGIEIGKHAASRWYSAGIWRCMLRAA
jgi:hypothetical protein